MKKSIKSCKAIFAVIIMIFISQFSQAQAIDLNRDALPVEKVKGAQNEFKNGWRNQKKASTNVTFDVDQLKEVVDKCAAAGIDTIKFLICSFRKEEVDQYKKQYERPRGVKGFRRLTKTEDDDLIGRPYLVIKVPRKAFEPETGSTGKSAALTTLLAAGYIPVQPFGTAKDEFLYLSIGRICPPPTDCLD